jgi:ribonuclease T1
MLGLVAACGGAAAPNNMPTLAPTRSSVSPTRTPAAAAKDRATLPSTASDGFATIRVDQLPPEARDTLALIAQGGPFPYRQDGVVFQNREKYLPAKPNGYYHEYTVKTPGSPDRGARRIITGGGGEMYYTDDHYASFKRIVR